MSWNKLYSGRHWSVRKREADRVHATVLANIDRDSTMFDEPVDIAVTYYAPNNRILRDPCNIPAKIYIDGLIGRIIKDDDHRYVSSVTTRRRLDRENPRVEIKISKE